MVSRERKGFTLIELLVVIAIIAILAAILFPVFAKAREKARQAGCVSNLKQWAMAFQMYASDYDGDIPPFYVYEAPHYWSFIIYPYVKNKDMWFCPSAKKWEITDANMYGYPGLYRIPYGLSTLYVQGASKSKGVAAARQPCYNPAYVEDVPCNLDSVQSPANKILMGDTTNPYDPQYGVQYFNPVNDGSLSVAKRHNEGTVVNFCDGHAKWFKFEYLTDPANITKLYNFEVE